MSKQDFFSPRPKSQPIIYAYTEPGNPSYKGMLKVGYTARAIEERMREHYPTLKPGYAPYKVVFTETAMRSDGTLFMDHEVHASLEKNGFYRLKDAHGKKTEWFRCSLKDVKAAYIAVRDRCENEERRSLDFKMRPEQEAAVKKTIAYFTKAKADEPDRPPKFLWNAKMRFGKTFAAYELAKRIAMKRVLVLTFKPAVESAWAEDLKTHVDFGGWQFISNNDARLAGASLDEMFAEADKTRPIVVFGSFQDLLGTNEAGGIKAKNEFIHANHWDMVIFDEYHFGAWRENAKKLFEDADEEAEADFDDEKYKKEEADNAYNESFLPITSDHFLFLSGTPFRALNTGEFIEDQIYSWTYSDEQAAKEAWTGPDNPYEGLPRMVMLTYQIPEEIRSIAQGGEFNEFDLNVFFSAEAEDKKHPETARFVYETEVSKWLELIRGNYLPASIDDLKLGKDKRPPMPFSDARLIKLLDHTLWFLPSVASCYAMCNLLVSKKFFRDYRIIPCAGSGAGIGLKALGPVREAMDDPLAAKTITLSCGKLTTGVTVRPWTGIFMLRNLKSPETYFQAAFRVQSPWVIEGVSGGKQILKKDCYLFDFAINRALRQISDYSRRLDTKNESPEKKVADFIHFLPVLAYDGSTMKEISAQEVLDYALSGTSATLLARRWESALLVNADNETLKRLLANKEALDALMKIEGFRSLNSDIETIINKSEHVKKTKKEAKGELTPREKKELSEEEKEFKSKRKEIQEKLIKFATRIPIFMYLTDFREHTLKDVVTQLEPELFRRVTGLNVEDFELLCSLGVFNSSLMNDAVYKFKRYEDSSLEYTGINRHGEDNVVGGWDSAIRIDEYKRLFYNQQSTLEREAADPALDKEDAEDSGPDTDNYDEDDEEDLPEDSDESYLRAKNEKAENKSGAKAETVLKYTVGSQNYPAEKTAPEKISPDLARVRIGSAVSHKKFGDGRVIGLDEKYIIVKFKDGEKKFQFPRAFEDGFLNML